MSATTVDEPRAARVGKAYVGDDASSARAVEYLAGLQAPDGRVQDYALPVGRSDQWVTAYVGLALAEAASAGIAAARRPAERAAAWLLAHRASEVAWGFNAATGPDADSTAHACLLFAALGTPPPPASLAWLEAQWRPSGGFATYAARDDAWAVGHPCVTPPVYAALHRGGRRDLASAVLAYLGAVRRSDGSWPAYWWRGHHYADFVTLRLLADLDACPAPSADGVRCYEFDSAFELACIVGSETLRSAAPEVVAVLRRELAAHQRADGSWPSGFDLRVTEPDCYAPWDEARGVYYRDLRASITTATCLRALTLAV